MAVTINPKNTVFQASPEHATVSVTNYVLEVCRASDPNTVVRPTDIGKPAPNAANDITVPFVKQGLSNNTDYVTFVSAVGPGGSTRSATPSGPFVLVDAPAAPSNVRMV